VGCPCSPGRGKWPSAVRSVLLVAARAVAPAVQSILVLVARGQLTAALRGIFAICAGYLQSISPAICVMNVGRECPYALVCQLRVTSH
jgi:hypothetical protein